MVGYLHWLEFEVRGVVRANRFWMTWNLLLAAVPAALALVLFRPGRRHGAAWWAGVGAFMLFLPNAPYVASDLKYLHGAIVDAASRGVVVTGVLPLFAAYVGIGFLFYWSAVRAVVAEVGRWRPGWRPSGVIAAIHLFCAVGVLLGRVGRLNSWNAVTSPAGTVHRTLHALGTPNAAGDLATAAAAVVLGYAGMSLLLRGTEALAARGRGAVERLAHRRLRPAG